MPVATAGWAGARRHPPGYSPFSASASMSERLVVEASPQTASLLLPTWAPAAFIASVNCSLEMSFCCSAYLAIASIICLFSPSVIGRPHDFTTTATVP